MLSRVVNVLVLVAAVMCLAGLTTGLATSPAAAAGEQLESKWTDFGARFQLGVTARYVRYTAGDADAAPPTDREFAGGLVAAYELTQHLSLPAQVMYGLDSKVTSFQVGLTWALIGP